jgi:hypothetical protein
MRVVAEFAGHPGAGDGTHAGLGQVNLSIKVLARMRLHLPLQGLDLLVEGGDQRGQGAGAGRAGGGKVRWLAEPGAAQRGQDRGGEVPGVLMQPPGELRVLRLDDQEGPAVGAVAAGV